MPCCYLPLLRGNINVICVRRGSSKYEGRAKNVCTSTAKSIECF